MSKKNPFDYPIFWEVRFVGSKKDKLTREDKAFYRTQVSRQFKAAYKTEAAAKAARVAFPCWIPSLSCKSSFNVAQTII